MSQNPSSAAGAAASGSARLRLDQQLISDGMINVWLFHECSLLSQPFDSLPHSLY